MVVGKGSEVKIKPGQHLYVVNQLYPYTIQFKEDPTGNGSNTKRPRDPMSEDRVKTVKQTEKDLVSDGHGGATKTNVKRL